jgi:hypothetical protein
MAATSPALRREGLRTLARLSRLSYHLPRKKEKSVCKAPGATFAPPSFQSHIAFSLPMLSTGYGFSDRPAKTRPVRTLISTVIVFPEAMP